MSAKNPPEPLTKQIMVRCDEVLYAALVKDAQANGRTVAQSVRHKLRELVRP